VISLRVERLSPETFADFGRVVERPEAGPEATGPGWRWWSEVASLSGDGRPWGVGYLDLEPTAPRFDWAERHMRTREAVFSTSADLFFYVGPALHLDGPARLPPLDAFRVFRVPSGSGVILDVGVWHGAPLAAERATAAVVLILEGPGRHDVTIERFTDTPVEIDDGQRP
jgi:hypothetical protein